MSDFSHKFKFPLIPDDTMTIEDTLHNGLRITRSLIKRTIIGTSLNLVHLNDDMLIAKVMDGHIFEIIDNHVDARELKDITLYGCVGITDATLAHIATNCTGLEKLDVSGCDQITDDGITSIVEKIGNNLKTLDYSGCKRCTDAALQSVVDHCPNLEELYANNTGVSKIPHDIGQRLTKIEQLWLSYNDIKTLPPSIALWYHEKGYVDFEVDDNPLEDPPLSIINEGPNAILKYFQDNGTLPSGIAEPPNQSLFQYFHDDPPESAPVHAPVPVSEEKSSPQKPKRNYDGAALYNGYRFTQWEINRNNIGGPFLELDNLDEKEKLVDGHIIDLIDNLLDAKELKYIKLTGCDGITDATLVHIANNCTRLIRLLVPDCVQITDVGIETVVKKIGNGLKHLSYRNCTKCTEAAFESIVDHCPNLEGLAADNTGITKIPHNIRLRRPSLCFVSFKNNEIEAIPPSIALLDGTKVDLYIRLDGNPLEEPPLYIVEEGPDAIYEYFQDNGTLPSGIAEPPDYSIFQFYRGPHGPVPVPVSEEQESKRKYGTKMEDGTILYTGEDFTDAYFGDYEFRLSTLEDEFKRKLSDSHVIDLIINNYGRLNDDLYIIDLSGCVRITDATLEYIAHHQGSRLHSLFVDDCTQITDVGIEAIAKGVGERLELLSYSNCKNCTDAAFQSIVDYCPNLEKLFADNTGISKIPHDIGVRLPSLCSLDLGKNEIKAIPPSLLNGKYLETLIEGNPLEDPPPHIVDEGRDAIVQYFQDNGTLPSGISVSSDGSNSELADSPVPISEEKSSSQERKSNSTDIVISEKKSYYTSVRFLTHKEIADAIIDESDLRLSLLNDDLKRSLSDKNVIDIIKNYTIAFNLKYVDLSGCVRITDATLEYIANHSMFLKVLHVKDCVDITDVGIEAIVEEQRGLKYFSYSNCTKCSDTAFHLIVEKCPELETLGAENTGISKIPHDIGARLPNLRHLDLDNNEIKVIPPSIALLDKVGLEIAIRENPLEDPPQDIVDEGCCAMFQYFKDNGTLPSGIAVTSDSSNSELADSPESVPVHVPVPPVSEEKSSLQERKRKYVVEIDHQLFDPEEFVGINVLHSWEKDSEKNADEKPTTPAKRRKGMFELIGETTIFFVEGLLGKN